MTKLLAHARSYGIELFCPGFPGAQATQVCIPVLPMPMGPLNKLQALMLAVLGAGVLHGASMAKRA